MIATGKAYEGGRSKGVSAFLSRSSAIIIHKEQQHLSAVPLHTQKPSATSHFHKFQI
jgi:hypothetical protein